MRTKATATLPSGYAPGDLQSAYNVVATGGTGRVVTLVEEGDAPTLEADLGMFSARQREAKPLLTRNDDGFEKNVSKIQRLPHQTQPSEPLLQG